MCDSGTYNEVPSDKERFALLNKAYELSEMFWDSEDLYMDSGDLLSRYFAAYPEKRKDIFLATKFGIQLAFARWPKRLGTDYVDLYYVNRLDGKTPIEQTMAVLAEFVRAGKIRHIGLSTYSVSSLRRAHTVHPSACIQLEYSVFCTTIETDPTGDLRRTLLATARELGVAVAAYSPLGRDILTGSVRDNADLSFAETSELQVPVCRAEA
ncbi:aldo-keto reductase [Grosmannia clavigera kw1407]|uniref:Aldo-keto reductase n=1 Tax=Grosmannia clavigera (strain kw1407 / UAMH 11150) TaxID=655863 RepID=F0XQM6_GROCL|nr:aldo-keto reductase [Grosmannia clavigera kw1407]EFW99929.1 aldo-keto reductase [Grosmannia clavigera kw1407]